MKKVLKWVPVALFVITAVYSGVAAGLLRGLGAYKLGTTLGTVLSRSWQYTAVAAFILLLIVVIPLALKCMKSRSQKISAAAPQNVVETDTVTVPEKKNAFLKKNKKEKKPSSSGKIAPAQPDVKIAPAPAAAQEVDMPTMPMEVDLPDAPAVETATMPMDVVDDTSTMPMPMDDETATMPMPLMEETAAMPMCESVQSVDLPEIDLPDIPVIEHLVADDRSTEPMPIDDNTLLMPEDEADQGATMLMPEDIDLPDPPPVIESAPVRFCTNCGAPVKEAAKFCGKCGTRLGGGSV